MNSYSRAKVAQFSSSDGHRTPSRNMSLYDLQHLLILIIVGLFRSPFHVRFPDLMSLHVMVIFFENIEMLWLKQLVWGDRYFKCLVDSEIGKYFPPMLSYPNCYTYIARIIHWSYHHWLLLFLVYVVYSCLHLSRTIDLVIRNYVINSVQRKLISWKYVKRCFLTRIIFFLQNYLTIPSLWQCHISGSS